MESTIPYSFREMLRKQKEQRKKQQEEFVQYRDTDGEIKISRDPNLPAKFLQEQEDRLAELPSIKFEDLIAHFMSKKLYSKITEPRPLSKFEPDPEPDFEQEKVAITSFSRSGNTLTRAYFQRLTGIVTGSESTLTHVWSRDLFQNGMYGEALRDDRVWGIKTHYPGCVDPDSVTHIHKAIVCVRNPLDTLVSLYQFQISSTHHGKLDEYFFSNFKEAFSNYVRQDITVWYDYYKFWLEAKIPIVIIRYEDILTRPFETFSGVMKLLLSTKSIEGRAAEKYVELVAREKAPQVYAMKTEKKLKCENMHRYEKEDLKYIYDYCKDLLELFGYDYLFTGAPEPENPREHIDKINAERLQQAIELDKEGTMISMNINIEELCVRYPTATREYKQYGKYLGPVLRAFAERKAAQDKAKAEQKAAEEKAAEIQQEEKNAH